MQVEKPLNQRINDLALALREFRLRMFDIPVHEGERDLIAIITDLAEAIEVADQDIKWVRKRAMSDIKLITTGDKHERFFTTSEDEWMVGDGFSSFDIGQAD